MKLQKKLIANFKSLNKEKKIQFFLGVLLFFFAIVINQYYGNKGLFPHDSASHFDAGKRILLGEHPIKDYWIISGFIIDYIQSFFFLLLGTSWQTYVLHASILNGLLTLSIFFFFIKLELKLIHAGLLSFSFLILAYPSSGTPFVDHHSSFFSFLSILFLILAIRFKDSIYWFFIPVLLVLSFLSKPVPAGYFIIFNGIIISYFVILKHYKYLWYVLLGSLFSLSFFLFILILNEIKISDFYNQYILYPQSIGSSRYINFFQSSFTNIIIQYKFIFGLVSLIVFRIFYLKFYKKINKVKTLEIIIVLISTLCFVLHQTLTKNQIFINFLIPFLSCYILLLFRRNEKISIAVLILCFFLTTKYHLRFNEERKFHELSSVNFQNSISASKISNKLIGLNWITPQRSNNVIQEINEINRIKKILKKEKNFLLLTNYSFFSVILDTSTHSPTRWFTFDGTDYPRTEGKFKTQYKNLFHRNILNNNINKIFIIEPVKSNELYEYFDKSCFIEKKYLKNLIELKIIPCKDITVKF